MSVEIRGTSLEGLKMELEHGPSGTRIRTAAPRDNAGDGSSFSPTDLLAASLGTCMVTTMAIVAAREAIPFQGASFRLEKHMRSDPRRVASIPVTVRMPASLESATAPDWRRSRAPARSRAASRPRSSRRSGSSTGEGERCGP
jgi:putative redox protein